MSEEPKKVTTTTVEEPVQPAQQPAQPEEIVQTRTRYVDDTRHDSDNARDD